MKNADTSSKVPLLKIFLNVTMSPIVDVETFQMRIND